MFLVKVLLILPLLWGSVSAGLYNSSDPFTILNDKNFNKVVLNKSHASVIEFYNSYCGHCVAFAPTWREFAKDIVSWNHTIKVGVIDCNDDENIPTCREYEVTGYPTIKLFGANVSVGDVGVSRYLRTVDSIDDAIVDFILEKQKAKNGSESWVNLLNYEGSIGAVMTLAPKGATSAVMIVEDDKSKVGSKVIMDLGHNKEVYVRSMSRDAVSPVPKSESLPILIFVDRSGERKRVERPGSDREKLVEFVMTELGIKDTRHHETINKDETGDRKDNVEGGGDGPPDKQISDSVVNLIKTQTNVKQLANRTKVYMLDMENAVSYALRHEVGLHKEVSGDALKSLKEFVKVLMNHFPARPSTQMFLVDVDKYIGTNAKSVLDVPKFVKALDEMQLPRSFLPSSQPFKACLGSNPKFRGIPCGLWTTWHTLTVDAYLKDGKSRTFDPKKVPRAINGFMKFFYSCRHCSQHFQEMYNLDAETSITKPIDGIMWFWRGHNKVNKRLAGDGSEDPMYPKVQFPTQTSCPACHNSAKDGQFNEAEVSRYLLSIYARNSISRAGLLPYSASMSKNNSIQDSNSKNENNISDNYISKNSNSLDIIRNRPSLVQSTLNKATRTKLPVFPDNASYQDVRQDKISAIYWGFTSTDINLCLLIYTCSTVIIFFVYFVVVLKRKMRRKRFIDNYKQP